MFRMCFVVCLLFLSGISQAQILNADRFGVKVDSSKRFAGDIQFNFNLNQQQTLITQFTTSGNLSYLAGRSLFILSNQQSFLRVDGTNALNIGFTHLRYRYRATSRFSPELFAQIQFEGLRGLQRRILAGGNLRFQVLEEKHIGLALGLGAMFEQEDWTDSDVSDGETVPYGDHWCSSAPCQTNLVKVNQYLSLKWQIEESITLDLTNYLQFVPDRFAIYPRVATDVSVTFKIGKWIKYRVSYQGSFDPRPPVPTRLLYYSFSQGLGFSF
ncbi:MAG: DUF481 domain-containing protein [Bacteroidota bacterium]